MPASIKLEGGRELERALARRVPLDFDSPAPFDRYSPLSGPAVCKPR
jgi:hypothetical protein